MTTSTSVTTTVPEHEGSSLYCFAVARPKFGELELMDTQLRRNTGIFACDEYSVFSSINREFGNVTRVQTEVVASSLDAPTGGIYNMSLNTEIFLVVWRRIFKDGLYEKHDWTVKVDPDAVFFPHRLRVRVKSREAVRNAKLTQGVFLNNCRIGNHGPIEIVSRIGMEVFKQGVDKCVKKNWAPFDEIGEDVFTRRCWRHLGVKPLDDFHLLSEINCFENPTPCTSGKVVFHPFKTPSTFQKCYGEATGHQSAPATPACRTLGCSNHYVAGIPCQCNDQCASFGNCCQDYRSVCVHV